MRRSVSIIIGILLLVVVGVVSLMAGRFERRMAIAQEDMAVLDFADPQADYAALEEDLTGLPLVSERPLKEIRRRRAMLQYWQADYGDLIEVARTAGDGRGCGLGRSGDAGARRERALSRRPARAAGPADAAQESRRRHPRLQRGASRRRRAIRRRVQLRAGRADARRGRSRQAQGADERQTGRYAVRARTCMAIRESRPRI